MLEEQSIPPQRLERHLVDVLPPDPNRDPVPRRLYLKQSDFVAHGTSDRCPGCRASASGGRAQGHIEECRIRVEGEIRKTQEGKARLRAAASRVGDAPTGRALKRVRFAESRIDDNAEVPEPASESAPSNISAEAASSSSAATPSTETAPPASAIGVPDQVMSEGASGAPDAAIRLSMKRSSDSPRSEPETQRHHADHSSRDIVMLLDDSDVGRAVEWCREVCRRSETYFVDLNG